VKILQFAAMKNLLHCFGRVWLWFPLRFACTCVCSIAWKCFTSMEDDAD